MTRSNVELELFGMEKDTSSSVSQFKKFLDRSRSFREIEGAISKINPEIIKSVIASGAANKSNENIASGAANKSNENMNPLFAPSNTIKVEDQTGFMPVLLPILTPLAVEMQKVSQTAPMTIFYKGTLTMVDVTLDQAECVLRFALEGGAKKGEWIDSTISRALWNS